MFAVMAVVLRVGGWVLRCQRSKVVFAGVLKVVDGDRKEKTMVLRLWRSVLRRRDLDGGWRHLVSGYGSSLAVVIVGNEGVDR